MPLRSSPVRTPALLAANRANAQKSTGPRPLRRPARGTGGKVAARRMPPGGSSLPTGALADWAGLSAPGSGQLEASRPAFGLGLVLPDQAWPIGSQVGGSLELLRSKAGMCRVFKG